METRDADVSVVMTVWDSYVGDFLREALASVLAEKPAVEVVIVDNASTITVPAFDTDRVTVVRSRRRLSCGAARNLGLERVRTPFVVMWDADDVMLPGTLRFLCSGLAADDGLVANAAGILDPSGARHRWPRASVSRLVRHRRAFAVLNSVWSHYPTTGATAMRTDVVRAAGGYPNADAAEDWALGAALVWRGRVAFSDRPGRVYRQHRQSVWRSNRTPRHLCRHARAVRRRLRADDVVPWWYQRALPLVYAVQHVIIYVVRPLRAATSNRLRPPPAP